MVVKSCTAILCADRMDGKANGLWEFIRNTNLPFPQNGLTFRQHFPNRIQIRTVVRQIEVLDLVNDVDQYTHCNVLSYFRALL